MPDLIQYIREDGKVLRYVPKDQRLGRPSNRDLERVFLKRPGVDTLGEWVPEGSAEILLPSTVTPPAVVVSPPPPPPLIPTPTPPPAPPPAIPVFTEIAAVAGSVVRGDGITDRAIASNTRISEFSQNIVWNRGGPYCASEVVTERAYADDQAKSFQGQGVFIGNGVDIELEGWWFRDNGYRWDQPHTKSIFRHGLYALADAVGRGGRVRLTSCLFTGNASQGAKLMKGFELVDPVFIDNAIGFSSIYSGGTISGATWYRGSRHWTGTDWDGLLIGDLYAPTTLKDCWGVGCLDGPNFPPGAIKPGERVWSSGAFKLNWSHPQYGRANASLAATDCRLLGWPAAGDGTLFGGDVIVNANRGVGLTSWPGFTISTVGIRFDPTPYLADAYARRVTIVETTNRLKEAIRGAATK